jgi:hypothetical protein
VSYRRKLHGLCPVSRPAEEERSDAGADEESEREPHGTVVSQLKA